MYEICTPTQDLFRGSSLSDEDLPNNPVVTHHAARPLGRLLQVVGELSGLHLHLAEVFIREFPVVFCGLDLRWSLSDDTWGSLQGEAPQHGGAGVVVQVHRQTRVFWVAFAQS